MQSWTLAVLAATMATMNVGKLWFVSIDHFHTYPSLVLLTETVIIIIDAISSVVCYNNDHCLPSNIDIFSVMIVMI